MLPFANVSDDRQQEYFSDGPTKEMLNALAQVPGLRVAARTSSFAFKDKNVPVDSVARVLEGHDSETSADDALSLKGHEIYSSEVVWVDRTSYSDAPGTSR